MPTAVQKSLNSADGTAFPNRSAVPIGQCDSSKRARVLPKCQSSKRGNRTAPLSSANAQHHILSSIRQMDSNDRHDLFHCLKEEGLACKPRIRAKKAVKGRDVSLKRAEAPASDETRRRCTPQLAKSNLCYPKGKLGTVKISGSSRKATVKISGSSRKATAKSSVSSRKALRAVKQTISGTSGSTASASHKITKRKMELKTAKYAGTCTIACVGVSVSVPHSIVNTLEERHSLRCRVNRLRDRERERERAS